MTIATVTSKDEKRKISFFLNDPSNATYFNWSRSVKEIKSARTDFNSLEDKIEYYEKLVELK